MRSITQILLVATLLVTAYAMATSRVPDSFPRKGTSVHQNNFIRAERLLFAAHNPDILLVGSSLAERLQPEFLGPEFSSLALGGGGPATGLEIVRRGGLKPRALWIETNLLAKDPDPELLGYLFDQPWSTIRRRLSWLRQSNQPINLLFSWLQNWHHDRPLVSHPDILRTALEHHRVARQVAPAPVPLNQRLSEIAKHLRQLKTQGIEVRLVEFPIHPDLQRTPYETGFDAELRRVFPDNEFVWLRADGDFQYTTTDGLHLDSVSARQFARVVRRAAGLKAL